MLTDGVVTLTQPQLSDADGMTRAVRASLDTLSVWMPWATPGYSAESSRTWLTEVAAAKTYAFVIRDPSDTIIGTCGLQRIDAHNRCLELGYWIGHDHTGNGYATRAARLAIAHAFDALDFHRVEILISVHNQRSQRVAERLHAHLDATLPERIANHGNWHDAYLYSVLATSTRAAGI